MIEIQVDEIEERTDVISRTVQIVGQSNNPLANNTFANFTKVLVPVALFFTVLNTYKMILT